MHPAKIDAKRRRTVLALTLALGVGSALPAQAYFLDLTVASINPGVFIAYADGSASRPPPVGSNLRATDLSLTGDLTCQLSPTTILHNRILNFPAGPRVHYFSNVHSATPGWMFDGISPQGSITLQNGIPCLNMPDATALSSGLFGTASTVVPSGNILHRLAPFSSTLLLLGSGLMGLVGLGWRRRKAG